MIPFLEVFKTVVSKIEATGMPYMIVGSMASMAYGEALTTRDLDLEVDIKPQNVRDFEALFPPPEYYCPPLEILTDEVLNRGQFNLLHPASGLKIDVVVKKLNLEEQWSKVS